MSASRIWNTELDFPRSTREKFEAAVRYAALAPTDNKSGAWNVRLTDWHLELLANGSAAQQATDPDGRESLIGCGAALAYLKLALKNFRCLGRVALFPDLDQPKLVARVHFGFPPPCGEEDKLLFEAMTTNRVAPSPAGEATVSAAMLAALENAVVSEQGWLDFIRSEMSRQRVITITLAGKPREQSARHEMVPPTGVARWPRFRFTFAGRAADSSEVTVGPIREVSALAVVKTKTDDKQGWVAAGQTMARAVLQAQALGLPWAFFDQVRRREAREALRTGIGHKGFAQVVLRFGSATTDQNPRLEPSTTIRATSH